MKESVDVSRPPCQIVPMRQARLKAPPDHPVAYDHCISRVVNRDFVLGDLEKEQFVQILRACEQFSAVRVLTFCVMSNHFHVLVEVPRRPEQAPSDDELLTRLKRAYSAKAFAQVRWKLSVLREQGADDEAEAYRESFLRRMWDVGFFMKALKQRFSAWFNRQRGRKGTLWEERYRSVLVESGEALAAMACYIDLNPVRAAIVEDTQDYRWCGYAQAMAGRQNARRALAEVTAGRLASLGDRAARTQAQHLAEYRVWLYGAGEEKRQTEQGRVIRRGFQREKVAEVLASGGKLDWWQLLRCRVRYFNDGAVLGTREFVNRIFQHERHRFGPNRKTGARPLRGVESNGLCALRDLRVEVLG